MRKVAAAALAVPVLAILYLPLLARRSIAARVALVATVGVIVVVAAFGLSRPATTSATAPGAPITALADDAFRSIDAATGLRAAVQITFSEAMDPRSVAAALTVSPAVAVRTSWDPTATILTVQPADHWAAGVYHTVTVAPGALAANGRPMARPVRAAFVTRLATTGRVEAIQTAGPSAATATTFRISFDQPMTIDAVRAALRIVPGTRGELASVGGGEATQVGAGLARIFSFTPATALAPGTAYLVSLDSLVDADGAPVGDVAATTITTSAAPRVVRFRPTDAAKAVARDAWPSVRFSEGMNHATTQAAFRATGNGVHIPGRFSFAEGNTVLIFRPTAALPYAATITISVSTAATSARGVPLGAAASAKFIIAPKPKVAPRPPASSGGATPTVRPPSGGTAVGGGSWGAVETYYLKLMNCTRTGGWVTSTGACSSPGGRNVAPLRLDAGISSKVSRPYARKLAVANLCTHFSGGNPGDRLRAAGYTSWNWAENLGCLSMNPYAMVLSTHLYFQNEKSTNGGHYVNMMNALYDRVGIGVWVASGRVRLVIDFYRPL